MIVSDYYTYNIIPLIPKIYSTITYTYAIINVMSFSFKYC